ncbi:DUF3884 family protein [Flavobacterium sp. ov086]|uniref:DUF3884 family protein n=1 Tax=Flavobacterium sp. ov086 TaxID=1761785 RepID=UPI000B6E2FBF|nr:DUF3884 family protein [Flavobacterium sp. ov086]SNR72430.1 Protein of unknown function [Flavobacterium sp. ov086]
MKKLYIIKYDVSDSQIFDNRVKGLGDWVKYFSDNWIVSSELSAKEIYEKITEEYENKSIFIVELNPTNYYGRMNTKVWEFLKANKQK